MNLNENDFWNSKNSQIDLKKSGSIVKAARQRHRDRVTRRVRHSFRDCQSDKVGALNAAAEAKEKVRQTKKQAVNERRVWKREIISRFLGQ